MKHIIEFNLPEEKEELELTMKAGAYSVALWDMGQYLRQLYKYDSDRVEKLSSLELLEEIRNKFYEIAEDRELDV